MNRGERVRMRNHIMDEIDRSYVSEAEEDRNHELMIEEGELDNDSETPQEYCKRRKLERKEWRFFRRINKALIAPGGAYGLLERGG